MKKKHRFFELTGALLAAVLIISGCQDVLNKPEDQGNSGGKVLITIGSGRTRTLAPPAAELGITQYVLTFSSSSATHEEVTINSGTSETVILAPGDWTITAEARAGATPRARGSWTGTINENGGAVNITPAPVGPGTGTFSYTISFPDLGASGTKSLVLYSVLESGGETQAGTPVTNFTSGAEGSITNLAPGFYRLQVALTNSDTVPKISSKTEAVHIYAGLETGAVWSFEAGDFVELHKTGIKIASLPQTIYGRNEQWSLAGLEVVETWSDGGETLLPSSSYTVSPDPVVTSLIGLQQITVTDSRDGYTDTFNIMVNTSDKYITNIEMIQPPSKLTYNLGETLVLDGMKIKISYSLGDPDYIEPPTASLYSYTYRGYDRARLGTQPVTVTVNQRNLPAFNVDVGFSPSMEIYANEPYTTSSALTFSLGRYTMQVIKGRPLPDGGLPENLKILVRQGGVNITVLTKADGDFTAADLSGYNQNQTGLQTLTLTLGAESVDFPIYVMDVDPNIWFDYGYWRHAGNPLGGATLAAPQVPQYTVPVNSELVITPVAFLMTPDTPSYTWTVISSAGAYASSQSGQNNKFFHITPSVQGDYEVKVNVTAGGFSGSATTKIVCTPARPATPPASVSSPTFSDCYPQVPDNNNFNGPLIKTPAPGNYIGVSTCLGTWGGSMVWKLRKMGSETIRIPGNSGGFYDEPGIVWVSVDDNRDGIPNDTWYEIPGSDDDNPTLKARIIRSFGLHYILMPGFTNSFGQTFGQPPFDLKCWVDNKGRIGDMQLGWPSGWGVSGADHAWLELSGTRLRGDPGAVEGGPDAPFGNGYVDSGYLLEFSVSNAMKADGTPANLPYIDFVRVQTGAFYYGTGVAGDLSTEIGGAEGL